MQAAGAAFSATFGKNCTHLVCYRAESEVYAKALLYKLEGQALEIVNHQWLADCVRHWRRMPEASGRCPRPRPRCLIGTTGRHARHSLSRALAPRGAGSGAVPQAGRGARL